MMFAFFAGLAAGLLHVFSGPDHLAAVTPLAADSSERRGWRTGLQWGVGHTTGVLLIAVLLLLLRERLPLDLISGYSERLVGLALIGVGAWGIRGAWVQGCKGAGVRGAGVRGAGVRGAGVRGAGAHVHSHTRASFAMGTIHGLAGSSHLFGVLPALAFSLRSDSILYLAGFGLGAMAGMTAFAAAIGALSVKLARRDSARFRSLVYASSAAALVVGGFWLVGR